MNDENAVHFPDILILWYKNRGLCPHAPTFFSFLDERKEGKRKSRPLPRPGKIAGYVWKLKNGSKNRDEYKIHLKNVPGKTSLPR